MLSYYFFSKFNKVFYKLRDEFNDNALKLLHLQAKENYGSN